MNHLDELALPGSRSRVISDLERYVGEGDKVKNDFLDSSLREHHSRVTEIYRERASVLGIPNHADLFTLR